MISFTSMYASESLNSFIEYLDEKYDSESYESEEEIKDEILFEHFIKNKKRIGMNRIFLNTFYNKENTRSDLAEKLELKKNEPQFRKYIAGFLRNVREESKNGYRNLPAEEQERILNCRLDTIRQIFGNDNTFNSRRILKYETGPRKYKQKTLPLRKEVTTLVIRCYKPKRLFSELEEWKGDKDSLETKKYQKNYYQEHKEEMREARRAHYQKHKDEAANLEPSDTFTSANQLELCPSL